MKLLYWLDVVFFLVFAGAVFSHPVHATRYFIGLIVAMVGFGLWITARLQLGESFTVRAKATRLVTTGLYSRIRHPIYVFGGLAFAGVFIAIGNWILFAAFMVMQLGMQLTRGRKEELVLEQAFGDEYRRHRAQTWF